MPVILVTLRPLRITHKYSTFVLKYMRFILKLNYSGNYVKQYVICHSHYVGVGGDLVFANMATVEFKRSIRSINHFSVMLIACPTNNRSALCSC